MIAISWEAFKIVMKNIVPTLIMFYDVFIIAKLVVG